MLWTQSLRLRLACWTLGMVAYDFVHATVFAMPLKYVPPDMVGSATGIASFGGQMAGVVAPSTMGLLIAHCDGSFVPAFVFLLCSGIVATGIAASWRLDKSLSAG
jgi:nitrate/nitrite transporter NarK